MANGGPKTSQTHGYGQKVLCGSIGNLPATEISSQQVGDVSREENTYNLSVPLQEFFYRHGGYSQLS